MEVLHALAKMHGCSENGLSDRVLPDSSLSYIPCNTCIYGMTRIRVWHFCSEWPKLHRVLVILSAVGLNVVFDVCIYWVIIYLE